MKKNPRKLSLGKETLKLVTGAGPTLATRLTLCGCPLVTANSCVLTCSQITCGYKNTCAPWGCQTDLCSVGGC